MSGFNTEHRCNAVDNQNGNVLIVPTIRKTYSRPRGIRHTSPRLICTGKVVRPTERLIMRDGARFRAGLIGQTRQRASLTVIIGGGSPCDTQRLEVPVGASWITADAVTGAEREAFVIPT